MAHLALALRGYVPAREEQQNGERSFRRSAAHSHTTNPPACRPWLRSNAAAQLILECVRNEDGAIVFAVHQNLSDLDEIALLCIAGHIHVKGKNSGAPSHQHRGTLRMKSPNAADQTFFRSELHISSN